jgi:hypothetical protein
LGKVLVQEAEYPAAIAAAGEGAIRPLKRSDPGLADQSNMCRRPGRLRNYFHGGLSGKSGEIASASFPGCASGPGSRELSHRCSPAICATTDRSRKPARRAPPRQSGNQTVPESHQSRPVMCQIKSMNSFLWLGYRRKMSSKLGLHSASLRKHAGCRRGRKQNSVDEECNMAERKKTQLHGTLWDRMGSKHTPHWRRGRGLIMKNSSE